MPMPCYKRAPIDHVKQLECFERPMRPPPVDPFELCDVQSQRSKRTHPTGRQQQRPLPPGTVPPPSQTYAARFGNKPAISAKRVESGKATFFHVEGQSWASKGFAELNESEVDRMRQSRPRTAEERNAEQERKREEQLRQDMEADQIRNFYHHKDEERRERERDRELENLDDDNVDEQTRLEAQRTIVLHKALNARYENDDRVRNASRAIGEAKCSAMWTAQLEERRLIDRMQEEYDTEQARKNNLYNESKWGNADENEQKEQMKRLEFGAAVRDQIKNRQRLRFIADDRERAEAQEARAAHIEYQRTEAELEQLTNRRKHEYRDELKRYISLHHDFQQLMCEQERKDEIRAYDYVLKKDKQRKDERQEKEAIEAEQKRKREVLFTLQQKALDAKDNREEMRYLAERERLERKYREQERAAVEKERRLAEDLRAGNREQMETLSKMKACYYMQRERELHEQHKLREEYEQEKAKITEQAECKKVRLRTGIAQQMEEHEKQRRRELENERLEFEKERKAEVQRQKEIDTVIAVKLDDLARKGCLPNMSMRALTGRVKHQNTKRLAP